MTLRVDKTAPELHLAGKKTGTAELSFIEFLAPHGLFMFGISLLIIVAAAIFGTVMAAMGLRIILLFLEPQKVPSSASLLSETTSLRE